MIFEKMANGITKHAKLVLILWVVLLCASIYPMMHASDSLSYDISSMGGKSSESVDGAYIAGDHFMSMADESSAQMLLLTYDETDATKKDAAIAAMQHVNDELLDPAGSYYDKISRTMIQGDTGTPNGLISIAVLYKASMDSDAVADDTGNLRKFFRAALRDSGEDLSGTESYVTGSPAISYDASEGMGHDLSLVEPLSIFLILFLVGLFFRSPIAAGAPPITIGVAYALVMCSLFFIGQVLDIFYIVQMLLLTSMLGAGCDYCIFILSRYREERRRGLEHIEASKEAIMWAGESVFTSGMAVMIGFGAMMICDFKVISTMGLGLALGIVFALLAALTLMSSLVVLLGDKLFWPSGASGPKHEQGYLKKMGAVAHKYFDVSTHFSIKHAKAVVVATILFSVPMVYVYSTSDTSYDMVGAIMSGESQEGMQVMTEYGDGGSSMPNYAILQTADSMGTVTYLEPTHSFGLLDWDSTVINDVKTKHNLLRDDLLTLDSNIGSVSEFTINDLNWGTYATLFAGQPIEDALNTIKTMVPELSVLIDALLEKLTDDTRADIAGAILNVYGDTMNWVADDPYVIRMMNWAMGIMSGQTGTVPLASTPLETESVVYYKLSMVTKDPAMADSSLDTVEKFHDAVHAFVSANHDVYKETWITGTAAVMMEISNEMSFQFMKIELTAIILIIILLFFVMKSYLTPIRSVVTIFMSVIWTVAITQIIYTDILGQGVLWMLPIILLVICLGLGMDYDILLTTRIREYRFDKGMENDEAIHQAVLHSGSVITICGVIMAFTFGTLMLSNTLMLQQMGFALWFAILVDALVVRTYIVPAAMHLMGEWNWKGPAFLHPKRLPTTHEATFVAETTESHEYPADKGKQ